MANPLSLIAFDKGAEKTGIIQQDQQLSRGMLIRQGAFVARRLSSRGVESGPVVLSLDSSPEFLTGLVGCWLAGAVPVLLDPLVRREIDGVLKSTGARVVIRGNTADGVLPPGIEELTPDRRECAPLVPPPGGDDDPIVYLFTSGSTGRPALVPKTMGQLDVEVEFLRALFDCPRRVATLVPWCHIFGFIVSLLLPMRSEGVCDLTAGISPKLLLERVAKGLIDLVVAVPAVYQVMCRYLEEGEFGPLPSHCRFVTSGAPMSPELRSRFAALSGSGITDLYGSTEAGGVAFRHDDGPWVVQPHVEVRRALQGFLEVKSPSVSFPGADGFYRIGDLVALEKGGFRLQGRADDIVKIGGRRTSTGEILEVIESIPEVAHAAVLALKIRGVLRLVAFVELAPQSESRPERIKTHVRGCLADHKVPRVVRIIDTMPRTPAGKVDRQRLHQLIDPGE